MNQMNCSESQRAGRFLAIAVAIIILASTSILQTALARPDDGASISDRISGLDQEAPCGFSHSKTVDPMMVEVGQEFDVQVRFDHDCGSESKKVHVAMVSCKSAPPDFNSVISLVSNWRAGMSVFIDKTPFRNGSTADLVLFDSSVHSVQRADLLDAIKNLRLDGTSCTAVSPALLEASKQFPVQAEDSINYIVLLDTGAAPRISCNTAGAAELGAEIAVIELPRAEGRWCPCATMGCHRAADNEGSDLTDIVEDVMDSITEVNPIARVEIPENLDTQLAEIVPNSWSIDPIRLPQTPSQGYAWEFDSNTHPPTGWELSYRVRIKDEAGIAPAMDIFYEKGGYMLLELADGTLSQVELERPMLCVARPGRLQEDCGASALTQTPEASATQDLRLTDTPTPTPEEPGEEMGGVYLPRLSSQ